MGGMAETSRMEKGDLGGLGDGNGPSGNNLALPGPPGNGGLAPHRSGPTLPNPIGKDGKMEGKLASECNEGVLLRKVGLPHSVGRSVSLGSGLVVPRGSRPTLSRSRS